MKLKDYKFEREEDYIVFKALLRCRKEYYGKEKLIPTSNMKNSEIIKSGYASRESHRNEPFLTNIFYWPTDIGLCRLNIDFKRLFYFIVLSELKNKGIENTSMATDLKLMFRRPFDGNLKRFLDRGYKHIIVKAMTNVFKGTDDKENNEFINLVMKGVEENIPF